MANMLRNPPIFSKNPLNWELFVEGKLCSIFICLVDDLH